MHATRPVPADRAAHYRANNWWDAGALRDGIEAAATARPDDVAVVDNERAVTWAELAATVAGGVAALTKHGVHAHDRIVLVAGNTVEGVAVYHAALRVGATTAVLDRRCGPADLRAARDALPVPVTMIVPRAERRRTWHTSRVPTSAPCSSS